MLQHPCGLGKISPFLSLRIKLVLQIFFISKKLVNALYFKPKLIEYKELLQLVKLFTVEAKIICFAKTSLTTKDK
jgi:hypothetical protein